MSETPVISKFMCSEHGKITTPALGPSCPCPACDPKGQKGGAA